MSFLDDLLAGGPDYRVTVDLGGAVFAPIDSSNEATRKFQSVADRIIANEGMGYRIHLIHRDSDYGLNEVDRITINISRRQSP